MKKSMNYLNMMIESLTWREEEAEAEIESAKRGIVRTVEADAVRYADAISAYARNLSEATAELRDIHMRLRHLRELQSMMVEEEK